MAYRRPRTQLATHAVTNQSQPLEDVNLFTADEILTSACAWSGADAHRDRLEIFGERVGSAETQVLAVQANRVPPIFVPYDRFGERIDEVEFHPAYHELMALGLEAGVSAAAWNAPQAGHALHAALLFLMGQADYGVCCPMAKRAPAAVSDGFIARRLREPSLTFGGSRPAVDEDAIIDRLALRA